MQLAISLRVFLISALVLVAACSHGSKRSGAPPQPPAPTLGTATVLSATSCPSGTGALPGTTCMHLSIDGLGNPLIEVELRITEADAGTVLRGTVLLATGGLGRSFYGDELGGDVLLPSLTAAGFRVVDRAWVTGWFDSGPSVLPQSGRFATLATWVHDNVHTTGAFCVTGNSGGASEIAYALTAWQRADLFDVAVIASGPPMTRLDYLCENPPSVEWSNLCATIVPAGVMECGQPACTGAPGNMFCSQLSPLPEELEADSILHPLAVLDYPNTLVHVLLGTQDCSFAVPFGLLFVNAVTSQKIIEFVPGTPHLIPSTAQGQSAILQALLDATTPAPNPNPMRITVSGDRWKVEYWAEPDHDPPRADVR